MTVSLATGGRPRGACRAVRASPPGGPLRLASSRARRLALLAGIGHLPHSKRRRKRQPGTCRAYRSESLTVDRRWQVFRLVEHRLPFRVCAQLQVVS